MVAAGRLVVPLLLESDIWAISDPLADEVWYASIISVPLYLLAMGLADYVFFQKMNWRALSGFVLRNVFTEHSQLPRCKRVYQKVLIIFWVAPIYVLAQSYAGNLTAMLTAPGLPDPIKNATEFLSQKELSLIMRKGSIQEYFFKHIYGPERIEAKLGEHAQSVLPQTPTNDFFEYGCFTTEEYRSGKSASICDLGEFWSLTSSDFGTTGRCNFYMTSDRFLLAMDTMGAFQV